MEAVGIICEYNPFHNGHIHHLKEVKKMFGGRTIILVLNGYFLERGEVSILSKENKTKLALDYGVDLVVELHFIMGSQSADIFANGAIKILHELNCKYVVFGSETNDVKLLESIALKQESSEYNDKVKELMSQGINYPTALAKALNVNEDVFNPNDLLGISYVKAIINNKYDIVPITIKRTNSYHDLASNENIISASNIRHKLKNKEDISNYVPRKTINLIENISLSDFYPFIKYKILTDNDLSSYLTVDEGIENRLTDAAKNTNSLEELIMSVKTKRYTYNKICRMLVHILVGVPKNINKMTDIDYIHILGFNDKGRKYLHNLKEDLEISLLPSPSSKIYQYEIKAALVYSLISKEDILTFEYSNKPIYKK